MIVLLVWFFGIAFFALILFEIISRAVREGILLAYRQIKEIESENPKNEETV